MKRFLFCMVLLAFVANAAAATIFSDKTTTTTISQCTALQPGGKNAFQAFGSTSSGSGAATVVVQGSNDASNWVTMGTITLTLGTTATSDGFASDASWAVVCGYVSAISGTGASVTLNVGNRP